MKRIDYLDNKTPEPKEEPVKEAPINIGVDMAKAIPVGSRPQEYWIGIDMATDPTDPRGLLGATIYGGRVIEAMRNDSYTGRGNVMEFVIRFNDGMSIRSVLNAEMVVRSNMPLIELLTNQVRGQRQQALVDRPLAHRPIRSMVDGFDMGFELAKPVLKPNVFKRARNWIRRK